MSEEIKAPKRGVGTVAREAIAAGKTNQEALEAVQAEFPQSKTSLQTISWYRNSMRKTDKSIPSGRSVKKAAAPAEASDAALA
jgi:hypothetical protein